MGVTKNQVSLAVTVTVFSKPAPKSSKISNLHAQFIFELVIAQNFNCLLMLLKFFNVTSRYLKLKVFYYKSQHYLSLDLGARVLGALRSHVTFAKPS